MKDWWHENFGYGFEQLTESEGKRIARQIHWDGIDAVRDRIIAARFAELNKES